MGYSLGHIPKYLCFIKKKNEERAASETGGPPVSQLPIAICRLQVSRENTASPETVLRCFLDDMAMM
jgi:hypothetical protein